MIKTKQIKSINSTCDTIDNYKIVNVLSWHKKDTPYFELSPYYLKTDGHEEIQNNGNVIFENFWQGSKVYQKIKAIKQYSHYSKIGDPNYLWYEYHDDILMNGNDILPAYYEWRNHLFDNKKPVRYPVGISDRKKCLFSLVGNKRLNYIEARQQIYIKEYSRLIRNLDIYKELLNELKQGINLCIYEIDVPEKNKKGNFKFVNEIDNTYNCTIENLNILSNDPSEAFGHGLCLAKTLLEDKN